MKFALAILLVAASVQANSLHRYGWTASKESVYKFESQVLQGIPEINNKQFSGIQLTCNVRVQSFSDYSLRIKLENPKFFAYNQDLEFTESGRVRSQSESQIPQELKKHLEEPFLAYLKGGIVKSFKVGQDEPSSVTNIKRSVLAQLQLDVNGSQHFQMESNHIQLPRTEQSNPSGMPYFFTKEESVHGKCRTAYTINKIPEYKAKELEEQWAKENQELKGEWPQPNSGTSGGQQYCEGKQYFQVVKTKDFDECEISPIFQKWSGATGKCNLSKPSSCSGVLIRMSSSTYYICGELSQYQIRHIQTENVIKRNPIGAKTDENAQSNTQVNMDLERVKSITERLPLPSNLREENSLVYTYPNQCKLQPNIPEEVVKRSLEILGVRPILPQPGLEEPPMHLIPVSFSQEQVASQVLEQLKKMAAEVDKSPDSCSSKSDIGGAMITVVEYLRLLSLSQLKELESKTSQGSGQNPTPLEKLFWESVSGAGTNPSTMLVVQKIKEGSLPANQAVKLAQYAIRSVRYPTQELLRELVSLAKHQSVKSNSQILTAILGNLSDLIYRAYVNPSHMINNFPSQIYGAFGSKDSQVLVDQYIPYLMSIAKGQESVGSNQSAKQQLQYSAIVSLGRTGHIKAAKPLLQIAEGKVQSVEGSEEELQEATIMRPLAVHSLKRIAKMNPPQIKPLLMAIIENPAEAPEVRTAAVAVLPFSQPNPNDIQAIAIRSWFEPSKHVANFIRSTLFSLHDTEVPEFKPISGFVKSTLPLLNNNDYGYIYSRNMHFNQFVHYLQTGVVSKYQLERTKQAYSPVRMSTKTKYYGEQGALRVEGLSYDVYMQGMDKLAEKYIKYFSYAEKTSESNRQLLEQISEQLKLKTRGFKTSQFFGSSSFMGIQYDNFLDYDSIMETLNKISSGSSDRTYSFNSVGGSMWQEENSLMMTDAGFPVVHTMALPFVYSTKGHIKVNGLPGSQGPKPLPWIEASISPVVNGKIQFSMGVISPFRKEAHGTGVEASVHSSIPVSIKAKVNQGELEVNLKNPTESESSGREFETMHLFVVPYTYVQSLMTVKPNSKSHSLKKLISGTPRSFEMPIGQSLGLSGKLYVESNNVYYDLASYIEKIRQTSVTSLLPVSFIPSSVRMSSTKIKYSPSQSSTKELQLNLKLRYQGSAYEHSSMKIRDEDVDSEFQAVKSALEKIRRGDGEGTMVSLTAILKGQSQSSPLKSAVLIGSAQSENGRNTQAYAGLNCKAGNSGSYVVQYEGKTTFTSPANRWNLDQLIQEQLSGQFDAQLRYGQSGQEQEIRITGNTVKSEEQKQAVKQSPEYQKCQHEMQEDRKLSQVCRVVRHQAASLDKFEVKVEKYPSHLPKNHYFNLLRELIDSYLFGHISYKEGSSSSQLVVRGKVDRVGQVAQGEVQTPSGTLMKINNLPLCSWSQFFAPLSLHNYFQTSLRQSLSQSRVPFSCAVEPKTVTTFDNKTYGYPLNDCEHLLIQDGSNTIPVSVTARSLESGSKKEVRIISGESRVQATPNGESVQIKVNGNQVQLPIGQIKKFKSNEGFVQVLMKKYQDNTVWMYFPQQGLTVITEGKRVEVVGSEFLWSRAVGLCGDMNGETISDLKSPQKCVMSPQSGAVSYLLNKSGSSSSVSPKCQGIPSQYKEQYEKESQRCVQERVSPTPLEKIFENINDISAAFAQNHVVDKHSSKICFSKRMINVCQGKPSKVRKRSLEFACVPKPSWKAESLEKRAYAGEPLSYELESFPTSFSKVEYEPVQCSNQGSY